jgi:glutathione S-transferase
MKLHDFAFSPNSRKVRAVAYELGVTLEYAQVDALKGESRTPAFLELNPNGRIPVLEDGDFVLWESTAIIRYLAAQSDRPGALVPSNARGVADVDRWLAWQCAHLSPAMSKVAFERVVKKLTGQGEPDAAAIRAGTADFETYSSVLERSLEGREYVAGTLSLADFALASHYSVAAMCGLDVSRYPRLNAWLGRVLARDSMRRALADAQASMANRDPSARAGHDAPRAPA